VAQVSKYEPVRASMMVNDEEVDVDLRPAAEAIPVVEEEQPEQLSLLSLEKSTEDLLVERVMQKGPLTAGKKEQIYEFAQTPHRIGIYCFPKKAIWL